MSQNNPIKQIIPTPLSIQLISIINCLSNLPLPLFKYCIDISTKSSALQKQITLNDQKMIAKIFIREKINTQIGVSSIEAVGEIHKITNKIIKLMGSSQPDQIQSNLDNCQKYIRSVLVQNVIISEQQVEYILLKINENVLQAMSTKNTSLSSSTSKIGSIQWSILNLKKACISKSSSKTQQFTQSNLLPLNRLYVKLNFSSISLQIKQILCQKESLLPYVDSKLQGKSQFSEQKCFTMSLIDFKLFMEEIETIKQLNQ